MTAQSVLKELESLGTDQNIKIYRRHGVEEDLFGVSYANLDKLARSIKKSGDAHEIACDLWGTGNHDAKVLATKLFDSSEINQKTAEELVRSVEHSLQASGLSTVLVETDFAPRLVEKWLKASPNRSPWKVYTGWSLAASISIAKKYHSEVPDKWFLDLLPIIKDTLHESANDLREQMNDTLIAIGSRNLSLKENAIQSARKIGKVEIDHGETSCKTRDAVPYIEKVWARKKK